MEIALKTVVSLHKTIMYYILKQQLQTPHV